MKVYIIYGPPAAGKTTYVRQNKKANDLVVDFDLIKQAITMNRKTENAGKLHRVAEGIREYLYKEIETRSVECENAWVIGAFPKAAERQQLAERLNAELIFINTSYSQCISRAMKDDERTDKELQLRIIDKWFLNYEESALYCTERWD